MPRSAVLCLFLLQLVAIQVSTFSYGGCQQKTCYNYCKNGYKRDARGCKTCQCRQVGYGYAGYNNMGTNNMGTNNMMGNQGGFLQSRCPNKPCNLFCQNGYKVDQIGCKICACRTSFGGGGYNMGGMNTGGMNMGGMNMGGMNTGGFNMGGMNMGGFNTGGYNTGGFNMGGFNNGWTTGKNGFLVAPCPFGIPKIRCPISPCLQAKCYRAPYATCVESYCGGCHAAFYVKRKRIFC